MSGKGRKAHHDDRSYMIVGTRKGAFFYESDFEREKWKRTGPFAHEFAVPSLAYDHRDGKTVYVASQGGGLHRTRDHGRSWEKVGRGLPHERLSHLSIGHLSEPGTIYAGLEPAGLAVSRDAGASFEEVAGFRSAPGAAGWSGRGGTGSSSVTGIVIHPDSPRRIHVSVSVGGIYFTEDGGQTWAACHQGFEDVTRLRSNPAKADRLYAATGSGVFRTEDNGQTWSDVSKGLPSKLTRTLAVSPSKPGTLFAVPLKDGSGDPPRVDGALAVHRSTDAGETWERLAEGLPDPGNTSVHPEALAVDTLDEEGLYLGTAAGAVFVSVDEGATWTQIASGLAPVLSLELITEQE